MPTWALILTSAAIGAAVSAAITIAGTLVGQHLERGARKRELLLAKAIDLARWKNDRTVKLALAKPRQSWLIFDEIYFVRTYFEELDRLFKSGKLSPTSEQFYQDKIGPAPEQSGPPSDGSDEVTS